MLIEVNPENTEMSSEMDLIIKNTSAVTLPEFVSMFKEN
jgi:NAD-dependent deacetylase